VSDAGDSRTTANAGPDSGLGPSISTGPAGVLSGPKGTATLRSRRLPLASPAEQIAALESVRLDGCPSEGSFDRAIADSGAEELRADEVKILQINVGKLCNMTCRHCHVDAGPDRWGESMDRETAEACVRAMDLTGAHTVDLTGGAPELNPNFRFLVEEARARGRHVIDRCNLTVLLLKRHRDLPEWLAAQGVEVVCSLPHHRRRNTDAQRGDGTFTRSIEALHRLNEAGYGLGDPDRVLTLVANPVGALLAGSQCSMETEWKRGLERNHGVTFDRLITLNNLPISRFLEWLLDSGNLAAYMELLVSSFNPATVDGLMCRTTLSVGWDGAIYDCDFNQMLELTSRTGSGAMNIRDLDPSALGGRRIVTGRHCFGCTAGAGSSCGGALE
jgi:radical SAM/Cys-rich protein